MNYIFTKNDFTVKERENIKMALSLLLVKVSGLDSAIAKDVLETMCFVFTKQTERLEFLEELKEVGATITPVIITVNRIDYQPDIQWLAEELFKRYQSIDD